jgi:transcription antitermination factor NusG
LFSIADCDRYNLYSVPGFLKYVSINGTAVAVGESVIDKVRHLCNYPGLIEIKTNEYSIGETVLIISGYFMGMKAQLLTKSGQSKIKIAIDELSWCAIIEIDKKCVQKIL